MMIYNENKLRMYRDKRTFSLRDLAKVTKSSIPTIIKWMKGEDIYVSKLISICNYYQLPINEFITDDNITTSSKSEKESIESTNVAEIMKYEELIKNIKEEYECRLRNIEKDYLERISNIKESTAEKWTKKMSESLASERKRLESKYEQKLEEKTEEIIKLRIEIALLKENLNNK